MSLAHFVFLRSNCMTRSRMRTAVLAFVSIVLTLIGSATAWAQAPAAPNFTGLSATTGKLTLSWVAVSGATYNIYRGGSAGGESTTPLITGVTGTSYQDTTVTNGNAYYYKMKAVVGGVESTAYSGERTNTPLAAPTSVVATPGNAAVTLTWASVPLAVNYKVYRRTPSTGTESLIASGIPGLSYTDNAAVNGTTYYYRVTGNIAVLSSESVRSADASATPSALLPLTLAFWAAPGGTTIVLTWNGASGTDHYNVKRATVSGGPYTSIGTPTDTEFTDTPPSASATYFYVVTATVGANESANSNEVAGSAANGVSATPLADAYTLESNPTVNTGQASPLSAWGTAGSQRRIFLTFPISESGGKITSATIKLYKYAGGTDSESVYGIDPSGWTGGGHHLEQPAQSRNRASHAGDQHDGAVLQLQCHGLCAGSADCRGHLGFLLHHQQCDLRLKLLRQRKWGEHGSTDGADCRRASGGNGADGNRRREAGPPDVERRGGGNQLQPVSQ